MTDHMRATNPQATPAVASGPQGPPPPNTPDGSKPKRPWEGATAQEAYFAGMRSAVPLVAILGPMYEGQSQIEARMTSAALGQIDILENIVDDPSHYDAYKIMQREARP